MGKFRMKLARFMYGRYGADELYYALFLFELVFLFVSTVCQLLGKVNDIFGYLSTIFYLVSLTLLVFTLYRFMSRKIDKRRRENMWYLRQKAKLKGLFKRKKKNSSPMDTEYHIFRQCPYCSATLRLPRQKGKHTVKCPRCSKTFGVKVRK